MLDVKSAIGLGAMRLSELDVTAALRLVHEAFDRGVRFFDTADVYAPSSDEVGHNERLLAKALRGRDVVVATKGGIRRDANKWIPDGRAKHLKLACEKSLKALNVDVLDVYQLHALDPKVPLATSMRTLATLQQQGKVRWLGLCNVRLEELEQAREIADIESVQVELSALEQTPLKNGIVAYCAREGIRVIAHSPLGGHRRTKRLSKLSIFDAIGKRHGVSAHEIALAWLRAVDPVVVPIPGATRLASLVSSLHAADLDLTEQDLRELDVLFSAGRVVRSPPGRVSTGAGREVVLFVGYPGAGKSTLARSLSEYRRLNRDTTGGRLGDLLPELDRRLSAGDNRIALDNTYPRRASRFDVLEVARKHGVPVRCLWLQTTLEQAQVNAARRMIAKHGRLLEPEEMKASRDPNDFTPEAQFRYRRELEPPRDEEGFSRIDARGFSEQADARDGKAVFIDEPVSVDVLKRYVDAGYRIIKMTYRPGAGASETMEVVDGVEIDVHACVHPPGPPVCWCRKPLPGLAVLAIEKYRLRPENCLFVVGSAADRGVADRVRIPTIALEEFARSSRR